MDHSVSDITYFQSLVADPDQIPLIEAAASLARDEHPGLDLQQVLFDVDVLCQQLADRCRSTTLETPRLEKTIAFFFREMRFEGNAKDYYDPGNSFIHRVLSTRRGIPITLAIVFIELARSAGLEAHGVSFPGHFLVRVDLHDGTVILDPFTGRSLSQESIARRLSAFKTNLPGDANQDVPAALLLEAAPSRDILLRMLGNLHAIYQQQDNHEKADRIHQRITILTAAASS